MDFRHAAEQLAKTHLGMSSMLIGRRMEGRWQAAHGRAERRIRQLSTKQQQLALVGCHRHTVQRKLREDDALIGTLGLPCEQLRARCQTPPSQGCGVSLHAWELGTAAAYRVGRHYSYIPTGTIHIYTMGDPAPGCSNMAAAGSSGRPRGRTPCAALAVVHHALCAAKLR